MNKGKVTMDLDLEIKNFLKNIEEMKKDVDLYGMLVEEKMLVTV